MKKTFNKNEKNKYLQEIDIFNNYPDYILPISNHYETETSFIIEYNDFQRISNIINKVQIDKLVLFLKFIQEQNIELDYFGKQTIYISDDTLLFTINNLHFENISINNLFYLDKKLYQEDYNLKNNIYMLGIFIYQNNYNKLPNFNKLSKLNKKPYFKFSSINYFSSYINRVIELCIYQNLDHNLIYDSILQDNINKKITHRLYFIDEVSNALYFSIFEGKLKDALYWSSELFGVGEYNKIIKILIKILIFKIGILYDGIFEYVYKKINNFNKNNNRKKKEVIIELITILCNCKKNSIVENITILIYKNIINDDLKLKININNIFNLLENELFKMIKILILQKKEDLVWKYLSQNGYKNFKYINYFKKYNKNALFLASLDFHRNKFNYRFIADFKINTNTLKYFGYNLKRNKNEIPIDYLNFDTIRGSSEVIRNNEYYGYDRYDEFNKLNIINSFTEEQKISYYGYKIFSKNQIKSKFNYKKQFEVRINLDYFEECFKYLSNIEEKDNYILTQNEYLNRKLITSSDCKTDQYNLILLDTE